MREYLKILVWLRKRQFDNRFILSVIFITIGFIACGVLADTFLPWNEWKTLVMFVRATLSGLTAMGFFSIWFILRSRFGKKEFVNENKEHFSVNQRVNLSILAIFASIILHLLIITSGSNTYTLMTAIMLSWWFWIPLVISPSAAEQKKLNLDVADERDLLHEVLAKNILEQSKKKSKEDKDE